MVKTNNKVCPSNDYTRYFDKRRNFSMICNDTNIFWSRSLSFICCLVLIGLSLGITISIVGSRKSLQDLIIIGGGILSITVITALIVFLVKIKGEIQRWRKNELNRRRTMAPFVKVSEETIVLTKKVRKVQSAGVASVSAISSEVVEG